MGSKNPGPRLIQWRSDDENLSVDALRDGSVTIRVTIGPLFMGATLDTREADQLAKFIIDVGIAQRAAEAPALHNPWDALCAKNGVGEPTREGERCSICRPEPQVLSEGESK